MALKSLISGLGLILLAFAIGVIAAAPLVYIVGGGMLDIGTLAKLTQNYGAARALLLWSWMGIVILTSLIITALLYMTHKALSRR
ncbi:MAG: hypothetical protein DRJ60_00805 [Thermoprotei archaeon]|nr:MAG: hypothetical protein DRJ60_00805 [Thermoprotei archaeon]